MSVNRPVSDGALRAYGHFVEQLYETCRSLHAAYQVDTGQDTEVVIPAWGQLTGAQQETFRTVSHPGASRCLSAMVLAVTVAPL